MNPAWITRIFARLDEHFDTWSDYVGGKELELKHKWAKGLAGMGEDDIKQGLKSAKTHKEPPDLEIFIRLCKVADNAYRETTKVSVSSILSTAKN